MEELLIIVIQFVIEVLGQALLELPFDWMMSRNETNWGSKTVRSVGTLILGCLVGGLSLLVLPGSLIHNSTLRCANLVVAPLVSYGLSHLFGKLRGPNTNGISAKHQAWLALLFTFGLAAVRLAYTRH